MSKYEYHSTGDFSKFLESMQSMVKGLGFSMSVEEEYLFNIDGVNVSTSVYERYSMMGKNRLSLTITTVGKDGEIHLVAIPAGGSQAVLFKMNTFGESTILSDFKYELEKLPKIW